MTPHHRVAVVITKLRVMRPGQADEDLEVDLAVRPSYHELRRIVTPLLDGGTLEHVLVYVGPQPYLGEHFYRDMFVDEAGHAVLWELAPRDEFGGLRAARTRPGKNLARNERATELYLRNVRLHEPEKPDDPDYFIVGPAVLFTERRVWS